MTANDMTPCPAGEPEQPWQLFREVFDLIDETVKGITDAEIENRLRQVLADVSSDEPGDLDELGRRLAGINRTAVHLDMLGPAIGLSNPAEWDQARSLLHLAQEAASEAALQAAAAERAAQVTTDARRQADEVTASADAYVDLALDRAAALLADAREQAATIVAEAEQQAATIVAEAEQQAATIVAEAQGQMPNPWIADSFRDALTNRGLVTLVSGPPGCGKTAISAEIIRRFAGSHEPDVEADKNVFGAEPRWRRMPTGVSLEVEQGSTLPGKDVARLCDAALDAGGSLLDVLPAGPRERHLLERLADLGSAVELASLTDSVPLLPLVVWFDAVPVLRRARSCLLLHDHGSLTAQSPGPGRPARSRSVVWFDAVPVPPNVASTDLGADDGPRYSSPPLACGHDRSRGGVGVLVVETGEAMCGADGRCSWPANSGAPGAGRSQRDE